MASKYDNLDASTELEQQLAADLKAALTDRGCEVIHNGTNSGGRHAPGGKADIEVRDHPNSRMILVEVTRRKSSSADGEFIAVTHHLEQYIKAGGFTNYDVLYISPATSARLSANFRDLWNRNRQRDGLQGRVVALDFEATEMLLTKLAASPSDLYPSSRFHDLFARWDEAQDDSLARLLVQQTIFPEDIDLGTELHQEIDEYAADQERELKKQLADIEDALRDRGVVGDDANRVLIYLTFLRLYEDRQQIRLGQASRFTVEGFQRWQSEQPATTKNKYKDRMTEALLHEIAEDPDLAGAHVLSDSKGHKISLHGNVRDNFVVDKLLPVFDDYNFLAGRVDVLGAVFETLARRGEKDTRIGQFFTPQPVVDFCADMVPLKPHDTVLDPAVGTARFLIRAMTVMLERVADSGASKAIADTAIRTERLLGSDIGSWVATIAKMNMYIHGDGKTNIRVANGLTLGDRACFEHFATGLAGSVDVVLTNPPLGETSHEVARENWIDMAKPGDETNPVMLLDRLGVIPLRVIEEQRLERAETALSEAEGELEALEEKLPDTDAVSKLPGARRRRRTRAERVLALRTAIAEGKVTREPVNAAMKGGALFLGAIADYLVKTRDADAVPEWRGGWAAVVVDEAILNTAEYGHVRDFIRQRFYIKAVISLGRQAFTYLAHTDAKTSVIFLTRKSENGKVQVEPIFYGHAERVGYSAKGAWVGDDLPSLRQTYDLFKGKVLNNYKGAWLNITATMSEVGQLPGFGVEFYAAQDTGGVSRLDYSNAKLSYLVDEMRRRFGSTERLGDYLTIAPREHPDPNRRGEYRFAEVKRTGIAQFKALQAVKYRTSELWIIEKDDLIVSGIDVVNKAAAVAGEDVNGMVMSEEMYSYRVKDPSRASAVYLQMLLRSETAVELIEGMITGTSKRTRLEGAEQLLELPIPPLPPLAEQLEVAQIYEQWRELRRASDDREREATDAANAIWRL